MLGGERNGMGEKRVLRKGIQCEESRESWKTFFLMAWNYRNFLALLEQTFQSGTEFPV